MGIPMNYYDVVFTIVSSSAVRASSPEKKNRRWDLFIILKLSFLSPCPPSHMRPEYFSSSDLCINVDFLAELQNYTT